jgi:hypothetical protein
MTKGLQAHEQAVKDPLIAKVAELFECDPRKTRIFSDAEWRGVLEKRRGENRKFWGSQFDDSAQAEKSGG